MPKSSGTRKKSRYKLKKSIRERGISPPSRVVQEFKAGQRVHIDIDPGVHKGMPHPKFQGRTAKVLGQRGRAYILEIKTAKGGLMIVKDVVSEKLLTLAEAKNILNRVKRARTKEEELRYEQRRALEHANKFAKIRW